VDGALHAVRVVAAHNAGAGAAARHAHADLALKDVHPVQQQRRVGLRSSPSVGAATGARPAAGTRPPAALQCKGAAAPEQGSVSQTLGPAAAARASSGVVNSMNEYRVS